ncbi:MAG TPA: hypothetical protein VK742_09545 [Candidatus Sulfotelmatobacter sp.]|jgi:hypothetical protein|nr:hypothetical protein [Candidatus Sulfotelmatobacter sp.]
MITKQHIIKTKNAGFVLGAVLLAALANGAISADAQVGIRVIPPTIVVAPPVVVVAPPVVVAPVVVVQDDYVYYPNYGIYYNSNRHQYAYLNNGVWATAATPYGVTAEVLLASPSVHMDWHDSPEKHHADMMQRYPKNWKSSEEHHDEHHDLKDDSKSDSKDDHKH